MTHFLLIFRSRNGSHSDFGIAFTQGDISRNPGILGQYGFKVPSPMQNYNRVHLDAGYFCGGGPQLF